MDKIKVGVVGVGHLGRIHTRVYSELTDIAELVGIYDQDRERAAQIAVEFKTKHFETMEELLSEADAVSCAVPTSYHFETGKKIAGFNCHLLIEKPITDNVRDAEELVGIYRDKGLVLMTGHTERFNPAMELCKHVETTPKFIEGHRLAQFNPRGTDVAVIYDLMIHDIDIILKLTGEEPDEIDATGVPVITPLTDIANARLKFPSGCVANITTSRISLKKMRKIRVFQPNSYISLDFLEKNSEVVSLTKQSQENKDELYTKGFSLTDFSFRKFNNNNEPLKEELTNFIESIRDGKEPEVTGLDGLKALRVCSAIEEIIKKGLTKNK